PRSTVFPYTTLFRSDVVREMRDRAQIEDLMWRYTRALDSNDADAYAATYTADGQFGAGANPTKGHDALRKMIADLRQRDVDAQRSEEHTSELQSQSN